MTAPLVLLAVLSTAAPASRATAPELFDQSRTAYKSGDFAEAARLLERAYQLDPDPTLLYNLARALENDGDHRKARVAYEQYLRARPDARDRKIIEARIKKLWARQHQADAIVAEQQRLTAERAALEQSRTEAPSIAPWIVSGGGAAVLATGGVLGALASSRDGASRTAANQRDAITLREDAERFATMANVTMIAGAAIAAGGVLWGVIDLSRDRQMSVVVAPGTVGVAGRF